MIYADQVKIAVHHPVTEDAACLYVWAYRDGVRYALGPDSQWVVVPEYEKAPPTLKLEGPIGQMFVKALLEGRREIYETVIWEA